MRTITITKSAIIFVWLPIISQCANILGVFPMPGGSHYILAYKLMKGLAEAGHNITFVSPFKAKSLPENGTIHEIVLDDLIQQFQGHLQNLFNEDSANILDKVVHLATFLLPNTNMTLHHPKVRELVESRPNFDAVIMEQFSNDGLKIFAHIFNCPLIVLNSMGPNGRINSLVGNYIPVSYVRHMYFQGDNADMNLIERGYNLGLHILEYIVTNWYSIVKHNEFVQSAFPSSPNLATLYKNISLVLLNSHSSLYTPQPLVPNMIEIGGYHIDPPKKLPQDLQTFLDEAKEGVIYFSMGSNLKSKDINEDKKKIFLNVLGRLKQKIIWKFEGDLPEKPDNMIISKWLSQQDILGHLQNLFNEDNGNILDNLVHLVTFLLPNTNKTLHHPKIRKLVESRPNFDAVIMEQFSNDGLKIFAHIFNCPLIVLNSVGPNGRINSLLGNYIPVSYIRHMYFQGDSADMNVIERVYNLGVHILEYIVINWYSIAKHNELVQSAFPNSPNLASIYKNISLAFLNSHSSFYNPQPLTPNMIEIGGYHIDPPKKLPQDLQTFLDEAKEGVIYFSMGSNLKSKDISEDKKKIFLNVLGGLKQKIIWKFEEHLPEKPDNMIISKWLSQQDILGVFPLPGGSHYILAYKLMKGLAEAGHKVTFVSPFKAKSLPEKGTLHEIVLDDLAKEFHEEVKTLNLFNDDQDSDLRKMLIMASFFLPNTNKTLHHPKVRKLVESKTKFDAVIMEHFSNHGLKVFSHIFECPLILLNSVGPNGRINSAVGNYIPASYVRHMFFQGDSEDMNFLERVRNVGFHIAEYIVANWISINNHNDAVQSAYPNSPDIATIYKNISLVLLNSHSSFYTPQPLVPNMVEVGGYHIDPPKKLPHDIQTFLDEATDGVIYFSMGSNLNSKDISLNKRKMFLKVLGGLKQKIIWKFEEDLPDKPDNMIISKWLSQQDILAHPNVKLFISHGGLLSLTETIHYGVPILVIPVFGDQPANAKRAVAGGYGLAIPYNDKNFTEDSFKSLIHELLYNSKYIENSKKISRRYHDRPMRPIDTAVYWIEYVIRNKGAEYLRVAGRKQPWYQFFLIDVLLFVLVTIFIVTKLISITLRRIVSVWGRNPKIKTQ
ncbi:hypothetical protein GWI33_008689 [Rhynchophorus ferrugineus]|uniref:UDP-glycosyltransferases domain-containing protein n=1 Tax=Rhynchophorus ferrugineus TaxID=354439 RepID=A0A834IC14_RHYFE|nr:hypothetical protein GWI33_008689 [Rhynchophorus ferrugineus]